MPVYEYGCEAGHRFEVKQKFSDSPITTCQVCCSSGHEVDLRIRH